MPMKTIDVYIPNLPQRTDRRESILAQYANRREFNLHLVEPVKDKEPEFSLWKTFIRAVRAEKEKGSEFFIFGEDDHAFTETYNPDLLEECIVEAQKEEADTLSGGLGWFSDALQVSERLFWLNHFNAMQFTVVFQRFYDKILHVAEEGNGFTLDWKISLVSDRNFCIYPPISRQLEFGYSDVTTPNGKKGFLDKAFADSNHRLGLLQKVGARLLPETSEEEDIDVSDLQIPTYVINLPSRTDRKAHILQEFEGKPEFDVHLFKAYERDRGADGLWLSIREIIRQAKDNEEEVVLICEDDHTFTPSYDREIFLRSVIEAGEQGCQMLSAGVGNFGDAIPVTHRRWWVSWLWCTQFIVIYSNAFEEILNAQFNEDDVADEFLSKILKNKQVLYPFMSIQKDFGYSDVTSSNNKKGTITGLFKDADKRFENLNDAYAQCGSRKA